MQSLLREALIAPPASGQAERSLSIQSRYFPAGGRISFGAWGLSQSLPYGILLAKSSQASETMLTEQGSKKGETGQRGILQNPITELLIPALGKVTLLGSFGACLAF